MDGAIPLLRSKPQREGGRLLENTHPGKLNSAMENGDDRPSRWNTPRALRALEWHESSLPAPKGQFPRKATDSSA